MGDTSRWRHILLTLGDTAFFDIIRNYLGEVKTPFNKHELISRLESFLVNSENQRLILSLVDEEDRRLLEAVDVLDEPSHELLFAFLHDEFGYVELHHRLLNLEDRLLVYRDPERKCVCLNPILEPSLKGLFRRERVFPGLPVGSEDTGAVVEELPWLNDSLVLALISYLGTAPEIYRADGALRKRNEEELSTIFPELLADRRGADRRLPIALGALESLGLLAHADTSLVPVPDQLSRIGAMSSKERHELYWLAAIFRSADLATDHLPFLHALQQWLPADTSYAPRTMEMLCTAIYLRVMRTELPAGFVATAPTFESLSSPAAEAGSASEATGAGSSVRDGLRVIVSGLRSLGVLCETEREDLILNPLIPVVYTDHSSSDESAVIVEPTYAVTIKPWLPLATGLSIAVSTEIRRFDRYPQYELTKSSFGRALARGYIAEELQFTLETLSGKPLPQNVAFSLSTWSVEYSSIALFEGVVLVADEKRRFLVEHSEPLRKFIRRTLAPGVFLLDPRERMQWEEVLKSEGVDMLPRSPVIHDPGIPTHLLLRPNRLPQLPKNFELFTQDSGSTDTVSSEKSTDLPDPLEVERILYDALEALEITRDKREEISERIRRKLIVHPDQINPHITRGERIEAKGLDYTGKIRLIEQVLKDQRDDRRGEYLEVVRRSPRGAPVRTLVRPIELLRSGTQLILRGNSIPDEKEVRIPVSKMVLVRKLKGTLFG